MNAGRYSKFIASLVGMAVVYVQLYGLHWQTVPAITGMAAALGVFGVPNTGTPGHPSALVAEITAAIDDLLAKRLVRIPKPAPAPAPVPAPAVQLIPATATVTADMPLQAGEVGPVPS